MKIRLNKYFIVTAFFLFISPSNSFSHPHVFVYSSIKIVFDEKVLTGFKVKWAFVDMFSNMIINDFDKNKNGSFETSEIEAIKNEAFSNLKQLNFTVIVSACQKSRSQGPYHVRVVRNNYGIVKFFLQKRFYAGIVGNSACKKYRGVSTDTTEH